jgi:hypothetical protein
MDLPDRQAAHEAQPPHLRPLLHPDHPGLHGSLCADEPRVREPPDNASGGPDFNRRKWSSFHPAPTLHARPRQVNGARRGVASSAPAPEQGRIGRIETRGRHALAEACAHRKMRASPRGPTSRPQWTTSSRRGRASSAFASAWKEASSVEAHNMAGEDEPSAALGGS